MKEPGLPDLQANIRDSSAFTNLEDYLLIAKSYLRYAEEASLTRIVSSEPPQLHLLSVSGGPRT